MVAGPDGIAQPHSNLLKDRVANAVSIEIVDQLESIHGDIGNRAGRTGEHQLFRLCHRLLQAPPVAQSGQRVVVNQVAKLRLGDLAGGDFLDRPFDGVAIGRHTGKEPALRVGIGGGDMDF